MNTNNKKLFINPALDIINFSNNEIIQTSGFQNGVCAGDNEYEEEGI